MTRRDILEMEQCGLAAELGGHGFPPFRARQIGTWIYGRFALDFAAMKNLPADLIGHLRENYFCGGAKIARTLVSSDGTSKHIVSLSDAETVETAVIPATSRLTFCLSSQVGCAVSCVFCASGRGGLSRNLRSGEIVAELLLCCAASGRRPTNIVFMGVGEPLMNYENLALALKSICSPEKFALSPRRITVSTSGHVPGIRRLASEGRQWNLAVSLHAPTDEKRRILVPGMRYGISEIAAACAEYREATGRIVTFEYTLISGLNDSEDDAAKFASVCRRCGAKANLIPFNESGGAGEFRRPSGKDIAGFEKVLERNRVPVTIRTEKGCDIAAACGQLRHSGGVLPQRGKTGG